MFETLLSNKNMKEQLGASLKNGTVLHAYLFCGADGTGKLTAATAFAGGLLSIKPVIAVEDGLVAMKGKARGSKQGNNLLRQLVEECGGIDFQKPFALAYSGLSDKLLQKYIDDSGELWQGMAEFLPISTVGCTIGTHAGPGAVAVAFFKK